MPREIYIRVRDAQRESSDDSHDEHVSRVPQRDDFEGVEFVDTSRVEGEA